jgi:hypothetical protein
MRPSVQEKRETAYVQTSSRAYPRRRQGGAIGLDLASMVDRPRTLPAKTRPTSPNPSASVVALRRTQKRTDDGPLPSPDSPKYVRALERLVIEPSMVPALLRPYQEKLRPREAEFQTQAITLALAEPNLSRTELVKRLDASAFIDTIERMLPHLERAGAIARQRANEAFCGWDGQARYYAAAIARLKTATASGKLSAHDWIALKQNYRNAAELIEAATGITKYNLHLYWQKGGVDPAKEDEMLQKMLEHDQGSNALYAYALPEHPIIVTWDELSVKRMDEASVAGVTYVGLIEPDKTSYVDGSNFRTGSFINHDEAHDNIYIGQTKGYEQQRFGVEELKEFLLKSRERLLYRRAFDELKSTMADRLDRSILEATWFYMAHEDEVVDMRPSLVAKQIEHYYSPRTYSIYANTTLHGMLTHRLASPYDLGSALPKGAIASPERVGGVVKAFKAFTDACAAQA